MLTSLYAQKDARTLGLIGASGAQLVCLQEAAGAFEAAARGSALGSAYTVVAPAAKSKSDQNSMLLLARDAFDISSVAELTDRAMALLPAGDIPIAPGDLLVICAAGAGSLAERKYLLASFHGDTNGLASVPVLRAVHALAELMPDHILLFGLDANTYLRGKPGKVQPLADFAAAYTALGYASCWGAAPDASHYTTFCARTFLQPQLQKACGPDELAAKGDRNPKDFILFPAAALALKHVERDNTGTGKFVEDQVIPTLTFPSDHMLVTATLEPK